MQDARVWVTVAYENTKFKASVPVGSLADWFQHHRELKRAWQWYVHIDNAAKLEIHESISVCHATPECNQPCKLRASMTQLAHVTVLNEPVR